MRAAKKVSVFCASALISVIAVPVGVSAGASTPSVSVAGIRSYPTVSSVRSSSGTGIEPAAAGTPAPLQYNGGTDGVGVTTGTPQVYLVFWGSQWGTASPAGSTNFSHDPSRIAPRLAAMYAGIGTGGERWSDVMTQYCEGVPAGATVCPFNVPHVGRPTNGVLAGVWDDIAAAAPRGATNDQLGAEARKAATHFGNTTAASNRSAQYVIVSATGTHPAGFPSAGFCAYHAFAKSDIDVAFTNSPYVPDAGSECGAGWVNGANGPLDGVTIVSGHEYAETITDQFPTGYTGGWWSGGGQENADRCAWRAPGTDGGAGNISFANGSFAMQSTFSNEAHGCVLQQQPRVVHVVSKQGTATLTDGSTSTAFVVGTGMILSSHPYVIDAGSDANCVDTGLTFYGYSLSCAHDTSLTINLGEGADLVRANTNFALTVNSAADPKDVSVSSTALVQLFGGPAGDTLTITHAAPGSVVDGGAGPDTINAKDGIAETVSCGSSKTNAAQADGAHDHAAVDKGVDTVKRCNSLDKVA
jgi:serine protease